MTLSRMTIARMITSRNTLSRMIFSEKALNRMTLSKMTLSKMTLSKMTFIKMTLNKMTLTKMTLLIKFSVESDVRVHSAECRSAKCHGTLGGFGCLNATFMLTTCTGSIVGRALNKQVKGSNLHNPGLRMKI